MRNLVCLPMLAGAALALSLVGCTAEQQGGGANGGSDNIEFVRLLEDARFEANEGRLAEAGRLFDEALAIEPQNPQLWVDIARLRFRGGEHLPSLEAADYALELGPQYGPALLMRAQLTRDAYGLAESLPWFEAAAAADPKNPEVLGEYAATLGDLGRNWEMLTVVREMAEFAPAYGKVHYLQAVLAARAGDPVIASSLLKRSGMREAGVPAALLLDALNDMQQANFDTAATTLEDLYDRQPGNVRVMELLARAYWLSGRDDEIVSRFGEQARSADASPYLVMLVGRALERRGDRADAAPFIARAYAGRPAQLVRLNGSGEARAALPAATADARTLIANGDLRTVVEATDNLRERFPGSSDVAALAGDAQLASSNAAAALESYQIASQIRRPWPLTKKMIAAFRMTGDDDAADVLLVRHLKGEPHNTEALLMLAERSAADEDWLRVAVLLDFAIEMGAGNDPKLLALRAAAADGLGDIDEARSLRRTLIEVRPPTFLGQ